jgi:hypothetical protein
MENAETLTDLELHSAVLWPIKAAQRGSLSVPVARASIEAWFAATDAEQVEKERALKLLDTLFN